MYPLINTAPLICAWNLNKFRDPQLLSLPLSFLLFLYWDGDEKIIYVIGQVLDMLA